ncbi:MAG: hypothetical protein EAZ89_07760, partial [Bacteroidetes bacterium]
LGLMLAYVLPGADKAKLGPFHLWYYINPYLLHLIPFTLFTSSIFFATVSLSRQQVFIYLNAIMVLVLLSAAGAITSQLDNKVIAALIDPTGGAAFQNATEFWTVTERNTLTIPYTAITVGNQLIWLAVAAAIWGFTFWRFSFSYSLDGGGGSSSKTPVIKQIGDTVTIQKVNIPKVGQAFGLGQQLSLLGRLIRDEVRVVLRSPIFWSIVLVGVLFIALLAAFSGQIFGTSTWPVTYQVLEIVQGNFFLFTLAIIIFYSGEMVWRERDSEVNQIYDALPIPNWLTLAAKFLAMTAILLMLMVVVLLSGLVIQMVQGYFRFEIGLYIQNLFGYRFINFLLFAVLAFFIQTLSDNKYLGFFLTILVFLFFTIVLGLLGVEDNLLSYMSGTQLTYSDMNGFGHFVGPFLLFKTYWAGFALMMIALAGALWVRGAESDIRSRWKQLRQRMTPATWATLGAGLLIFVASGAYIFYNTHILNEFVSSRESQRLQAESEKTYKKYENALQPRIRSVSLNVNLYPERRGMEATGRYSLQNPHSQPIDSIHVTFLAGLELKSVQFDRPSEQVLMDEDNGYAIYRLKEALAPGDSIQMDFSEVYETTGFANSGSNTQLVEHSTG